MTDWRAIGDSISREINAVFTVKQVRTVGGGCINTAAVLEDGRERYFVKLNSPDRADMFAAEREGLQALAAAQAVRVPRPITCGRTQDAAFLVLEHLDLGPTSPPAEAHLGEQVAALHRVTQGHFGWHRANTLGTTTQTNLPDADWVAFFGSRRLEFQLDLAARNGHPGLATKGAALVDNLGAFFSDYQPPPSLLHGDLWSGNHGATAAGEPVVFDPAVYYGDREADIAMTELFGGFSARFYHAYKAAWPLDPGYATRKTLYNLYHVLNHLNLFGGSYRAQAGQMLDALLSEIR